MSLFLTELLSPTRGTFFLFSGWSSAAPGDIARPPRCRFFLLSRGGMVWVARYLEFRRGFLTGRITKVIKRGELGKRWEKISIKILDISKNPKKCFNILHSQSLETYLRDKSELGTLQKCLTVKVLKVSLEKFSSRVFTFGVLKVRKISETINILLRN